jgi:hypothetical protein
MLKWAWFVFWVIACGFFLMAARPLVLALSACVYLMSRVDLSEIDGAINDLKTFSDCRDNVLENL